LYVYFLFRLQSTLYNVSVRFNLTAQDVFPAPREEEVSLDSFDGDDTAAADGTDGAVSSNSGEGVGIASSGDKHRVPPPSSSTSERSSASWAQAIRSQLQGDEEEEEVSERRRDDGMSTGNSSSDVPVTNRDVKKPAKPRSSSSSSSSSAKVKTTQIKQSTTTSKSTVKAISTKPVTNTNTKTSTSNGSGASRLSSVVRRVLHRGAGADSQLPQAGKDIESNKGSRVSKLFGSSSKQEARSSIKCTDINSTTTSANKMETLIASHLNATRIITDLTSQLLVLQQVSNAYQLSIQQREESLMSLREAVEQQVGEIERR
jgi:hypothetical protein